MKNNLKWIAGVFALVIVIAGAYYLYNNLSPDYAPENFSRDTSDNEVVSGAPDFTVTDTSGNKVKLSQMKGKATIVNFWASWCPPCKAEMPDFEKMYLKYGSDVQFMMINMTDGQRETIELAKKHIKENSYTFPVYFDTAFSAANAYRASSIPATYFINADGNIVTHSVGMISADSLEKGIELIKK